MHKSPPAIFLIFFSLEEENEDYNIVTNLSCPQGYCHVDVYHPSEKLIIEYEKSVNTT